MSYPTEYTQVSLKERPKGHITSSTFNIEKRPFQELLSSLAADQVLIQVNWISLDPAMRGWLNDTRSYLPPVGIGQKMRAGTLGTVLKCGTEATAFQVGEPVFAYGGERCSAVVCSYSIFSRMGRICRYSRKRHHTHQVCSIQMLYLHEADTTLHSDFLQTPRSWIIWVP